MRDTEQRPNVRRDNQNILFFALNHPRVVSEFLISARDGITKGYSEFVLEFRPSVKAAFPNACAPLAGLLDHFRNNSIDFSYGDVPEFIVKTCLLDPETVDNNPSALNQAPLNRVWRFKNSEEINQLVDSFVDEVRRQAICEPGIVDGLTWCLNEVMDNVLQHSGVEMGYVMGQIHRSTKHIAFCVFDPGRGIFNSLKSSKHAPRNPIDAITLAIKEGVTRDSSIGQGNGMWGLHNIIKANSGVLVITSTSASYMAKGDVIKTYSHLPIISRELGTTTVDFQIDFDKGISISEALGGYKPIDLRIEALEDDKGNILYELSKKSSGTGTRQSGERIRNEIMNMRRETNRVIEIDFSGISVISSSFADELVGKLVAEYGFYGFHQVFRLNNMNEVIQSVVNRSVSQRMATTFAPDRYKE